MTWALNVNGFFAAMENGLQGTNGYCAELCQHGKTVRSYSTGNAIDGPLESTPTNPVASVGWTTGMNMQIGSCSKLVTSIALTKILQDAGVSAGAVITPYLPAYWELGPNVEQITFANLMTMTSGLSYTSDSLSQQTYVAAREDIATGVLDAGDIGNTYTYLNINFDVCRVLMATVSGAIDTAYVYQGPPLPANSGSPGSSPPPFHHLTQLEADDDIWDERTIAFYEQYVQENILVPAGVTATLSRPAECALAYAAPPDGVSGWNSGDMSEYAGPAGWHMSVTGLLTVMGVFRRAGTIMSPVAAQAMLDAHYGIDWQHGPQTSPAGNLYPKNGSDGVIDRLGNGQVEQSGLVFLPLDMECVVFVNSPSANDLLDVISGAFTSNLVEEQLQLGGSPGI